MTRLYLIVAMAFVALSSEGAQLAQKSTTGKVRNEKSSTKIARKGAVKRNQLTNRTATTYWSDDFSNPATWVAAPVAGTDNWIIGTTGPSGAYFIDPINSATATNGFALFDSDLLCSGNQIANLTMAGTADLSAATTARVVFSQYYRHYFDSTFMFVSNNGGTTWTKFNVNPITSNNNFNSNNAPAGTESNPDIVSVDITSLAAGSANVKIRFQFYSPSTLNASAGCAYSWMIDDVSIENVPSDDIGITEIREGEYSSTPLLQVQPVNIGARVKNFGAQVATNVQVEFNIYDGSPSLVFNSSSNAISSLNPGDTTTLLSPVASFTPSDTGVYYVEYICSMTASDGNTSNDTTYGIFYVDTAIYARDYTFFDGAAFAGGFGFNGNTGYLGQTFQILQQSQFTNVSFYLANATLGDEMSVDVFDVVGGVPNAIIGTTGSYTITSNDTGGAFLTLPLLSSVNVSAGDYFVGVNQIDTNNITLGAATKNYTPGTALFQVAAGTWNPVELVSPLRFILRVDNPFSSTTGISDLRNDNISVY
ncbi:MAG: hypothetical protein ACKOA1_03315, partial [Bacteroidota bacterium]